MTAREPILTPHEIASNLHDGGQLSRPQADQLERRIAAWATTQRAEWRFQGIVEALRRVQMTLPTLKSAGQKTAVQRAIYAIQKLLPKDSEEFQRGYKQGVIDERRRTRPEHTPT